MPISSEKQEKKKKSRQIEQLWSALNTPQLLDWCYGFMGTNWSFVSCSRKTLYIHFLSLMQTYITYTYSFAQSSSSNGRGGAQGMGGYNWKWKFVSLKVCNLVGSSKNYLYFQIVLILQVHIVNYKYNWLQWAWGRQRKKN